MKRFILTFNNHKNIFIVDESKSEFQLMNNGEIVSKSGFNIENPDEWFNQKYLIIHDLKTFNQFRHKGFAEFLLSKIFKYTKNKLNIKIISLIVYKENFKATNLYFKCGFEIFKEYDDSFCLIKKL